MQKNEFEKQLQEKMGELKIHPSESVWQNIEINITREKRRRLVWIFFPLLLIGVLWSGYLLWRPANNLLLNHNGKLLKNVIGEKNTDEHNNSPLKNSVAERNIPPETSADEGSVKSMTGINHNKKVSQSITKRNSYKRYIAQPVNRAIAFTKFPSGNLQKTNSINATLNKESPAADFAESKNLVAGDTAGNVNQQIKIILAQIKRDSSIKQIKIDSINKFEPAKNEIIAVKQAKAAKHTTTKNPWSWGLAFSAGVSGIPNSFLGSLDKSYSRADALFASVPSTGNFLFLPTKIESSEAMVAGFFAEKSISKKKIITIGLNYKKFSSINKVGVKIDSLQGYNLSNPINTYHNYYHFLELPVNLKIQLNAKVIPLFWDAGISLSELISSNALQFNNVSSVYHQRNSLFNKTQIGFNTGLSASLFSRQNKSILIGPYLYYGITRVAAEGLYKNQHFTFIGLRTQLLFKK